MADEEPTAAEVESEKAGRVTKVMLLDRGLKPVAATTHQEVNDDPFKYGPNGLQEPPYNMELLVHLAEKHQVHSASLEQKSADIAGTGWEWEKAAEDADEDDRKAMEDWLDGLADPDRDETTAEIIHGAWLDVETVGHGTVEIARDSEGKVQKIFSMPAHTTRFHKDGVRLAQGEAGKRNWFKRWIPGDFAKRQVKKKGGELGTFDFEERGNDILVLRRPTRRRSWYGVPTYVSAVGWISLSLSARDDNIHFFNNRREPRWAVILENIEDDDGSLEEALRQAFSTSLKEPHRNVFIPIEGNGKIHWQKMTDDAKDMSFERLQERADAAVLIGHRMPPDRLGMVRVGPLGGNAVVAASRIYKEAVVMTSQELLQLRINRFIQNEGPVDADKAKKWKWKPKELDITEQAEDVTVWGQAFQSNLAKLNEARQKIGLPPIEPETEGGENPGDKFFFELAPEAAQAGAAAGAAATQGGRAGAMLGLGRGIAGPRVATKSDDEIDIERMGEDLSDIIRERLAPGGATSGTFGGDS